MVNTRCNVNVTFTSNIQANKETLDSCGKNMNKEAAAAQDSAQNFKQSLTSVFILRAINHFIPPKKHFASMKRKGRGSVGKTFFKNANYTCTIKYTEINRP